MVSTHYNQIAEEISHGEIDRGLWIEAFAVSQGDERATRAQYIKLRLRKLHAMGLRAYKGDASGRHHRSSRHRSRRPGALGHLMHTCRGAAEDLWTAWFWMWTFSFAALTAVGLLGMGTMLYLKLYDDGLLAWPFFTIGCAFMTCFLFGRGVQCFLHRPPTLLFYVVELLALCTALWPISHLMNPALLGRIPHALSSELVFLVAHFLNSGDPVADALTAAVFFLPVYGVITFLRQQRM